MYTLKYVCCGNMHLKSNTLFLNTLLASVCYKGCVLNVAANVTHFSTVSIHINTQKKGDRDQAYV